MRSLSYGALLGVTTSGRLVMDAVGSAGLI